MQKIKRSEKVTNEEVLERIGEKRALLNTCKEKQIGCILRRNCLLHEANERQMTEMKSVER